MVQREGDGDKQFGARPQKADLEEQVILEAADDLYTLIMTWANAKKLPPTHLLATSCAVVGMMMAVGVPHNIRAHGIASKRSRQHAAATLSQLTNSLLRFIAACASMGAADTMAGKVSSGEDVPVAMVAKALRASVEACEKHEKGDK